MAETLFYEENQQSDEQHEDFDLLNETLTDDDYYIINTINSANI